MFQSSRINSPILRKITLIILLISLGSTLTSGLFIHEALNRQFQNYLTRTELAREEQITKTLAELYQESGGWGYFAIELEKSHRIFFGNLLYVTDSAGRVVLVFRHSMMNQRQEPVNSLPVKVGNNIVGIAYFGHADVHNRMQNLLTRQDELFRVTINYSIIWSILITGLISLLVAFVFARRLSTPITEMNQTAKDMTTGNLETRVKNLPQDELGELGSNINRLAERLKQVQELRKKMTADVAHDLRTPLATVRSHLEGMIDQVIPSSQANLESLLEEVYRLISLVNDLQAISLTDAAVQQFNLEPINIGLFLKELVKSRTPLFKEKGIQLEFGPTVPLTLISDRDALNKIFDNLLSNALKFTPAGKKVIVKIERQKEWMSISVKDQGIGIAVSDLPYIFERFYRADQSRNRENGGFGLGLTIVKELIEALGGVVTVDSELATGSEFTVKFPLQAEPTNK